MPFGTHARQFFTTLAEQKEAELSSSNVLASGGLSSIARVDDQPGAKGNAGFMPHGVVQPARDAAVATVADVEALPVGVPCESPEPWQEEARAQLRDSLERFYQWDSHTFLDIDSYTLPNPVPNAVRVSIPKAQRGPFLNTVKRKPMLYLPLERENWLYPQTPEAAAAWREQAERINALCASVEERARGRWALMQELRIHDDFRQKWQMYRDISSKYGEGCPDLLPCPEVERAREIKEQLCELQNSEL
jgi:hypothetical protein